MKTFYVGDYVRAAWITNSRVQMSGIVERVTKTRVYVRGRDRTMDAGTTRVYQFNAQDKGARFMSWDGYLLAHETRDVLVSCETGAIVACGDIIANDEGEKYRVELLEAPHKPAASGRVYVKPVSGGDTRSFYVTVFNLEWINRKDRVWIAGAGA